MTPQLQMLKDAAEYADGLSTDPNLGIYLTVRNYGLLINVQHEDKAGKMHRIAKQLLWVDIDSINLNVIVAKIDEMLEALKKQAP